MIFSLRRARREAVFMARDLNFCSNVAMQSGADAGYGVQGCCRDQSRRDIRTSLGMCRGYFLHPPTTNRFSFQDMSDTAKVVLISGGNTGIGAATAELLASQGWRVIISGRNADSAKRITDSITAKGGQVRFLQADIGREDEVIRLHKHALEIWGRLDAAVNNAGISTDSAMFHDLDTKHFRDMLEVNVLGLFWSMKEQVSRFRVHLTS